MDNDRQLMQKALNVQVLAHLRQLGFSGAFPHLRRMRGDITDLLSFQFDKYGGGFVIELAQHRGTEFKTYWGKIIGLKKLNVWDTDPAQRKRITADPNAIGTDGWFRYDTGELAEEKDRFAIVAHLAAQKLSDVDTLFRNFRPD